MNSLKLIPAVVVFFLFSCSTKTKHFYLENNFTAGLDHVQTSHKTGVKKGTFLTYANAANFETLLRDNNATLVLFGMVSNDYSDFEKKYGIKVKTENCVITPGVSQLASVNNQLIADHLQQIFKDDWKNDLKVIPFGLN